MENQLNRDNSPTHEGQPNLDWMCRVGQRQPGAAPQESQALSLRGDRLPLLPQSSQNGGNSSNTLCSSGAAVERPGPSQAQGSQEKCHPAMAAGDTGGELPQQEEQLPALTQGGIEGLRALGRPLPGEHFPQETASPLEPPAALQQGVPKTDMENHLNNANSPTHEGQPNLDWLRQENTFLNLGQPLAASLEGFEVISRRQKVLHWLEAYVTSESETLAKDDEDGENNIDKELSPEMLEDDISCPVSSEMWEDSSQSQKSQDMSEEYNDQELFQSEEDEGTATAGEAITGCYLQNVSPALASPMDTKDEPATPSGGVSPQQGQASTTTPTSTGHAPSTPSWDEHSVPGMQAGACLLPTQPLGDRSPSHIHALVQQQQQSLFRRVLRAVFRVFLGTPSPQEHEQQCPAPSTRLLPGDGHSEP